MKSVILWSVVITWGPAPMHEQVAPPKLSTCRRQCVNTQSWWHLQVGWGIWHVPHVPSCVFSWSQPYWTHLFKHQGVAACKSRSREPGDGLGERFGVQRVVAGSLFSHPRESTGLVQALQVPRACLDYSPFQFFNTTLVPFACPTLLRTLPLLSSLEPLWEIIYIYWVHCILCPQRGLECEMIFYSVRAKKKHRPLLVPHSQPHSITSVTPKTRVSVDEVNT